MGGNVAGEGGGVRVIWLVDYDGKIENLALMRLSTWHKRQGDKVRLKRGDAWAELFETPDKVYISSLFRWHKNDALRLAASWDGRSTGDLIYVPKYAVRVEDDDE